MFSSASLPGVTAPINNLAEFMGDEGRHEDTVALRREALAIRRELAESDGDGRADLARSLKDLATSMCRSADSHPCRSKGLFSKIRASRAIADRYLEAESLPRESIDIQTALPTYSPAEPQPELAESLELLARILDISMRKKEAEKVRRKAAMLKGRGNG